LRVEREQIRAVIDEARPLIEIAMRSIDGFANGPGGGAIETWSGSPYLMLVGAGDVIWNGAPIVVVELGALCLPGRVNANVTVAACAGAENDAV
jgi:hypothetical protein